jgi:hypothetical protein
MIPLLLLGLATILTEVRASEVVLDFNDHECLVCTEPYYEDGFQLHILNLSDLGQHYDIGPGNSPQYPQSLDGSPWFGSDHFTQIRLDAYGHPFSLLGLDLIGYDWTMASSKGGLIDARIDLFLNEPTCVEDPDHFLPVCAVDVSGPDWRGIRWVDFQFVASGPFGFDNLRLRVGGVPEPGSIPLIAGALAAIAVSGRRRQAL